MSGTSDEEMAQRKKMQEKLAADKRKATDEALGGVAAKSIFDLEFDPTLFQAAHLSSTKSFCSLDGHDNVDGTTSVFAKRGSALPTMQLDFCNDETREFQDRLALCLRGDFSIKWKTFDNQDLSGMVMFVYTFANEQELAEGTTDIFASSNCFYQMVVNTKSATQDWSDCIMDWFWHPRNNEFMQLMGVHPREIRIRILHNVFRQHSFIMTSSCAFTIGRLLDNHYSQRGIDKKDEMRLDACMAAVEYFLKYQEREKLSIVCARLTGIKCLTKPRYLFEEIENSCKDDCIKCLVRLHYARTLLRLRQFDMAGEMAHSALQLWVNDPKESGISVAGQLIDILMVNFLIWPGNGMKNVAPMWVVMKYTCNMWWGYVCSSGYRYLENSAQIEFGHDQNERKAKASLNAEWVTPSVDSMRAKLIALDDSNQVTFEYILGLFFSDKKIYQKCDVCNGDMHVKDEVENCCPCKAARYCSRECQRTHYPKHKKFCAYRKQLKAEKKKAKASGIVVD